MDPNNVVSEQKFIDFVEKLPYMVITWFKADPQ